jgi:hypothetical protein
MNVNLHGSHKDIEWTDLASFEGGFIHGKQGAKPNSSILDSIPQQAVSENTQSIQREKADQCRENDF